MYLVALVDIILAISNFVEFKKIARLADERDDEENGKRESSIAEFQTK
jgi:hypothetical protein